MQVKTESTKLRPSESRPADLPGPLPALGILNRAARSLGYVEGSPTPLESVVEGVRTLLHADGVAILIRESPGEYVFRVAQGVLAEWADYTLSGTAAQLLETLLLRDEVTLFKRKQKARGPGNSCSRRE